MIEVVHRTRAGEVEGMRRTVVALEPSFALNVEALTDWRQFTLLSVASSRCSTVAVVVAT